MVDEHHYAMEALAAGRVSLRRRRPHAMRVWDLKPAGAAVATLAGQTGTVKAVAALADSRVVSGSSDGALRVWDLARGAAVATLEGKAKRDLGGGAARRSRRLGSWIAR